MDAASKQVIDVITYLLPGFVAAWIFYGLTAFSIPSQFERVVQALIFTVFIQSFTVIERWITFITGRLCVLGTWTSDIELVMTLINAIMFGL